MIKWMLETAMRQFMSSLHFPYQGGEESAQTTREVLDAFKSGYMAALRGREASVAAVASVPWNRHDFFWEGTAVAVAGLHAMTFSSGNPDRRKVTDIYRRMMYTGYGFWNGIGRAMPMPVPSISLKAEAWTNVEDFPQLGPLIAGGIGFAVVGMKSRFDASLFSKMRVPEHIGWREAVWHGCGRALWFLCMHNAPKLEEIAGQYPELRDHLLTGAGMAVAFTQIGTPDRIVRDLASFSPAARDCIRKGVGVTLAEIPKEDPDALARIDAIDDDELQSARRFVEHWSNHYPANAEWYRNFSETIRTDNFSFNRSERAVGQSGR